MNNKIKSLIVIMLGLLMWILQSISIPHDLRTSVQGFNADGEIDDANFAQLNFAQTRKRVTHDSERSLRARPSRRHPNS